MDTYLGMDFGGTKLLIGEVSEKGKLLHSKRYETCLTGQERMAGYLVECVKDYWTSEERIGNVKGAGVGIVGISDYRKGLWISATHEEGTGIPLAASLSGILGVPVGIDNDVKSATCAELLWGSGRESRDFIYVNAGTGLAAGFVVDGYLLRGISNDAGEIGHHVLDIRSSRKCICGRVGCAELSASGIGIHKMVQERIDGARTGLEKMPKGQRYPADRIFALAREGDPLCLEIAEEAAGALACTIMNLVRVTDPELVILGGGLLSDNWFFSKVKEQLDAVTMRHVKKGVQRSQFAAAYSGVIGAAAVGCFKVKELACEGR